MQVLEILENYSPSNLTNIYLARISSVPGMNFGEAAFRHNVSEMNFNYNLHHKTEKIGDFYISTVVGIEYTFICVWHKQISKLEEFQFIFNEMKNGNDIITTIRDVCNLLTLLK